MPSDVPVFLALGTPDGTVKPDFPAQLKAWVRRLAGSTGTNLEIRITEAGADRTNAQNSAFHAAVYGWAKEKGYDVDPLKQYLLAKAFGWTEFPDLETGEVLKVLAEPHTSKLSRAQFVHLFETTMEVAANDDYIMATPDEYKAAKAAVLKKLAKGAA